MKENQREIKFRVWDKVDYMSSPFTLQEMMWNDLEFTTDCPVMQFTGLKDKNGREIYEGDIIMVNEDEGLFNMESDAYEVYWGGDYPAFSLKGYEDCEYNSLQHATCVVSCEVIGNIYEHPHLLTPSAST